MIGFLRLLYSGILRLERTALPPPLFDLLSVELCPDLRQAPYAVVAQAARSASIMKSRVIGTASRFVESSN
jgi:hypothetical protein